MLTVSPWDGKEMHGRAHSNDSVASFSFLLKGDHVCLGHIWRSDLLPSLSWK